MRNIVLITMLFLAGCSTDSQDERTTQPETSTSNGNRDLETLSKFDEKSSNGAIGNSTRQQQSLGEGATGVNQATSDASGQNENQNQPNDDQLMEQLTMEQQTSEQQTMQSLLPYEQLSIGTVASFQNGIPQCPQGYSFINTRYCIKDNDCQTLPPVNGRSHEVQQFQRCNIEIGALPNGSLDRYRIFARACNELGGVADFRYTNANYTYVDTIACYPKNLCQGLDLFSAFENLAPNPQLYLYTEGGIEYCRSSGADVRCRLFADCVAAHGVGR